MGLLKFISKPSPATLLRLPTGSFTVDRNGRILASTLPQDFPAAMVHQIVQNVLSTFRAAQSLDIPLTELVADYSALKLTARELRGGAIVFLSPRGLGSK